MKRNILITCALLCCGVFGAGAQVLQQSDNYLKLDATINDPLYTTYAAAMERSRLYGDKAYKMIHYQNNSPIRYSSDKAGSFFNVFMVNKVVVDKVGEFYQKPVVEASFPDMAIIRYQPFRGVEVKENFLVHSSQVAVVDMNITNKSADTLTIVVYPVLELGNDSLKIEGFDKSHNGYILRRHETKKRLISNLRDHYPYPTELREFFSANFTPYAYGGYKGNLDDFYLKIKTDYYAESRHNDSLNLQENGLVDFVALQYKMVLKPGETRNVRYIRGVQKEEEDLTALINEIQPLKTASLQPYLDANEKLFKNIPRIDFNTKAEKLVYLGSFNLARGCMLPPEGQTSHNYYVFSRNPVWGWGHGHQVLHESLSMLAYVYLDPQSAQASQRVYMEQQGEDGLIAYRHGPRGPQTYPHKGEPTTSAPFYSWINWEIYQVSRDRSFLKDAYESGQKYMDWLVKNRDDDRDGTFEWGPYGLIENVRDWYNVVFQVSKERHLDIDKEDISDELECLDLSLMVTKEMRCLAKMAGELGDDKAARRWVKKADKITALVNERMWDAESGFYYNIDKKDHSFFFMTRDLKRQEIIGFLPLWAEAAPRARVEQLVQHLTDTTKFWRRYGVPTVAADDPWYSAYVDYCCKWNGPVWLLWDYMVYQGLRNYGYDDLASSLAQKMMNAVTVQLSKNHNFWESFSPDNEVLDSPSNYIWDAIMAKLLIDEYGRKE